MFKNILKALNDCTIINNKNKIIWKIFKMRKEIFKQQIRNK